MKYVIIAIVLLVSSLQLKAQTCCSGGVPLSANIGLPASEKGSFQLSISYDRNLLKTLNSGSEELKDRLRERITNSLLIEAGYTINTRWSVDAFFSVVEQRRNIFSGFGTNRTLTRGIGDMVVLLKYNLLTKSPKSDWQIGIGPKLPTGRADKRGEGNISLPADLQPGSGSFDAVLWSNFATSLSFRPTASLFVTTTYRATGENDDYLGSIEYEFGNELQVIAGISDRYTILSSLLIDQSLTFHYRKAGRDINNSENITASGGEWFFITPGISVQLSPKVSLNASLELPLYSFVNNTQLTPTNRMTAGVFFKLPKRTEL